MKYDLSGLNPAPPKTDAEFRLRRECRVLVVDDYEDNRSMLRTLVQRKGIVVLEARDGREAVEVACQQHPDGILMAFSWT